MFLERKSTALLLQPGCGPWSSTSTNHVAERPVASVVVEGDIPRSPPLGRVIAVCDLRPRGTAELGGNREISSTLPALSRVALEQCLRKGRPATRAVISSIRDQKEINFISGC